jgi:membrane associated rhomboid family serine protease
MTQQVKRALRDPMLVTKAIVAVNVLMFIAKAASNSNGNIFAGGSVTNFDVRFGLSDLGLAAGNWWQPLTSGFVHYGVIHIFFNMVILWRLGEQLEDGIGRGRYVTLYFASLFAGSLGSVILDKGVAGGASGAVFGLAAAATVALRQRGVSFWQTGWGPLLGINLLLTFTGPNVSVGGHLGGLVCGIILGFVMLDPHTPIHRRSAGVVVGVLIMVASLLGAFAIANQRHGTCVELDSAGRYSCEKR